MLITFALCTESLNRRELFWPKLAVLERDTLGVHPKRWGVLVSNLEEYSDLTSHPPCFSTSPSAAPLLNGKGQLHPISTGRKYFFKDSLVWVRDDLNYGRTDNSRGVHFVCDSKQAFGQGSDKSTNSRTAAIIPRPRCPGQKKCSWPTGRRLILLERTAALRLHYHFLVGFSCRICSGIDKSTVSIFVFPVNLV